MAKTPPRPWSVYEGKLRPRFPLKILEVVDANGASVLPWSAFDDSDRSFAERRRIAHLIVEAVNAFEEPVEAVRTALGGTR